MVKRCLKRGDQRLAFGIGLYRLGQLCKSSKVGEFFFKQLGIDGLVVLCARVVGIPLVLKLVNTFEVFVVERPKLVGQILQSIDEPAQRACDGINLQFSSTGDRN